MKKHVLVLLAQKSSLITQSLRPARAGVTPARQWALAARHSPLATFCSLAAAVLIIMAGSGWAFEPAAADRVTAAFSDPSRPGLLKVNLIQGSITVKAYDGKEVVIESTPREARPRQRENEAARGMRRIPANAGGLTIEEENNVMRVKNDALSSSVDLAIQVPRKTSLNLKTINDGNIDVSGVDGEIEVDDINGSIALNQVAGTVVAHALNGKLKVTMTRVDAEPMAFDSLHGDINVTFPASLRATVNLRTDMGETYSDFEINLQASAPKQVVEDGRAKGGKYVVKIDRSVSGTINGGGPEIQFKNFNGNIYIRKAGAAQ